MHEYMWELCVSVLYNYVDICNIHAPIHGCITVYGAYVCINAAALEYMACLEVYVRASMCVRCVCVCRSVSVAGVTGFPIKLNHRPDQC